MTLAVARIFGDRIAMLSDTMISDPRKPRPNVIPGRLKSIILSKSFSISYAGGADYALDIVRKAKRQLDSGTSVDVVLDGLAEATGVGSEGSANAPEFIVAAHRPQARLYKISGGQIASGVDRYWIGDMDSASDLHRLMDAAVPIDEKQLPEFVMVEEVQFGNAFRAVIPETAETRGQIVGGLSFCCVGTPRGHWYPR